MKYKCHHLWIVPMCVNCVWILLTGKQSDLHNMQWGKLHNKQVTSVSIFKVLWKYFQKIKWPLIFQDFINPAFQSCLKWHHRIFKRTNLVCNSTICEKKIYTWNEICVEFGFSCFLKRCWERGRERKKGKRREGDGGRDLPLGSKIISSCNSQNQNDSPLFCLIPFKATPSLSGAQLLAAVASVNPVARRPRPSTRVHRGEKTLPERRRPGVVRDKKQVQRFGRESEQRDG